MENRKGQAAMEFLMTYGWAILAAIIVIGVLAIYFRPGSLATTQPVVNAPFYGVGATVSTSQVDLEIRNNGGEQLDIVDATISISQPTGETCNSAGNVTGFNPGATTILSFDGCSLESGATFSADVTITYNRPDSSLNLTSSGQISGSVA